MKTKLKYLLGAGLTTALLISTTVAAKANQATPVQRSTSRPLQKGYVLEPIPFSAVHHGQTAIPRIRLWQSTSANWSGYAVPRGGSAGDTFTEVEGTWVVPTVTGARRSTTYSSVWVGLDGYGNGTVEQIGTEQDWWGTKQRNYVWFEMYPSGAYKIGGFPADPGDSISAQVLYVGQIQVQTGHGRNMSVEEESVFQLTIINNTQNASYTVPSSYTTTASASRSSAEWIVEAPWSGKILPLADFGTVSFSGCSATGGLGTGSINSLWTPDPLTMIDPSGGKSVPNGLSPDGTAFSVNWSAQ